MLMLDVEWGCTVCFLLSSTSFSWLASPSFIWLILVSPYNMHSLIGLYSPYVGTKARCLQEKELLRLPFDNCYLYGHPSSSFDSKAKVFVASNVATDHLYRVELDVDD